MTEAASIQNYKLRQIMLSFAYLAYSGQDIITPNPEQKILNLVEAAMLKLPPIRLPAAKWAVVWGPAVFTMPGALYQDNMMFVAQSESDPTQYVVAIRGTNFISDLDWLMEDLDILQMIEWPVKQVDQLVQAKISESTSIDLQILLTLMKGTVRGGGTSVVDFLSAQTGKGAIKLCVTGHSLGGCVAGTLALYLMENRNLWDNKHEKSTVACTTFAAPTAGNASFAGLSDRQFANEFAAGRRFPDWDPTLPTGMGTGTGTNFDAVRCTLDVAPLGWTTAAVTVPTSGKPDYPPVLSIYNSSGLNFDNSYYGGGAVIGSLLQQYGGWSVVSDFMTPRDYLQVVANATPLQGTFQGSPPPTSDTPIQFAQAFIAQARYQHGESYPVLLNVPELNTSTIATRRTRKPDAAVA